MSKTKKEETQALLQEKKKQENSKQKFLKSISKVKFKLDEEDLLDDKKIKSGFYEPCDEIRSAVKTYYSDVSKSDAKSKKPEFLKFRLNKKQLDNLVKTISNFMPNAYQKNKDIYILKNDINSLIKALTLLKKSILPITPNNRKIRKILDVIIKYLISVTKLIDKCAYEINKKNELKRKKKDNKVYLQPITIVGYKIDPKNPRKTIDNNKLEITAYNLYSTSQETYSKISSLKGVQNGQDFYNGLDKNYDFSSSSEYNRRSKYLCNEAAKNTVVQAIKGLECEMYLQEGPHKKTKL